VTIYTTSWCPYCKAAKQWVQPQGFTFSECDVENSASCASEMQSMGGHGVPFLVVRGHRMKGSFNSDEFIAALKRGG
jgi:glutaredoxin